MQSPVSAGRSRPCFQRRAPSLDKRLSFVQHQLLFTCHSERSEESLHFACSADKPPKRQ